MLPLPHLPSRYALEQFYLHSELCCESDQLKKDELDRASTSDGEVRPIYRFLEINNLTHFFTYLFISCLYMFQASQCSGNRIVLIHHLV